MSMDNIGLKQKIAILIIVCVFLPLITTNSFIFWNMKKRSDSEQQKTLENSINAIVYEFQNAVAEQTSIADYLCRDARLKNFLGTSYQSESDYYSAYTRLREQMSSSIIIQGSLPMESQSAQITGRSQMVHIL